MKKLLICMLALALIGSAAFATTYTNLHDLQNYVFNTPASHSDPFGPEVRIRGIIKEINYLEGNHYEMVIEVNEDNAATAMGQDLPCLVASFRLHIDDMPFEVGQDAYVVGSVNLMYSSPLIPNIILKEINGYDSDEF